MLREIYRNRERTVATYTYRAPSPTKILTRRELAAVLADLKRKAPALEQHAAEPRDLPPGRLLRPAGQRDRPAAHARRSRSTAAAPPAHPHRRGQGRPAAHGAALVGRRHAGRPARLEGRAVSPRRCLGEPFVASSPSGRANVPLSRHTLRKRFRTACKVLGPEPADSLTIHHGRHTFISHALAGGRTLAEVRDAAGHANVSITSGYLHVAVEDGDTLGSLFG